MINEAKVFQFYLTNYQSIRMGANGRGWRRFLVFAALTKGRKGNEYVALFTYFSFEGRYAFDPFRDNIR